MPHTTITLNPDMHDRLRDLQASLGQSSLKDTTNLLVTLGALVVQEAIDTGAAVTLVDSKRNIHTEIRHPVLDNIRRIRGEQP